VSIYGLWDSLASRYGTPTTPSNNYYSIYGSYTPQTASTPAAQGQAPTSTGGALSAKPIQVGGGGASPNYLGLARQGASMGNTLLGGNSPLGMLSSGLGIYGGLASGTPVGDARAAVSAGQLANKLGAFGSSSGAVGSGLGAASGALGLYGGIKEGGVAGDTQAALGAAQMAAPIATAVGSSLAPALAAAGPIGLALAPALYGMSTPAYTMPASYYQHLSDTLAKGPGTGGQSWVSGDSPEGQQYGNYFATIGEAQASGDPEERAILARYGISPNLAKMTPAQEQQLQSQGVSMSNPTTRSASKKAKGGEVIDNRTRSKLRKLYEGSFANRVRHFDDGGGVSYYDSNNLYFTPTSDSGIPYADLGNYTDPTLSAVSQSADSPIPNLGSTDVGQQGLNSINYGNPNDSSLGAGGMLSGLGSLLGVSSMGQLLQKYGALAPLIAAAVGGGNKPASAPATPAGFSSGTSSSLPQVTSNRTYTPPNVQNWYTYGEGPEQSFYSNNQIPTVQGGSPGGQMPASSPATANIQPTLQGGMRSTLARGGAFSSPGGDDYVPDPGHGDGTSDDIDAKLSGGEYVMDAGTVSMLGNGSNEAGARALDQLRQRVRKHAGKHLVKGKQFMKAKAPDAYLRGSKT
jgi:hypothetical protein